MATWILWLFKLWLACGLRAKTLQKGKYFTLFARENKCLCHMKILSKRVVSLEEVRDAMENERHHLNACGSADSFSQILLA